MTTSLLSSQEAVFTTVELLEMILSHVDERTLLLSQRTCKQIRDVVEGSPSLQEKLFLRPAPLPVDGSLPRWRANPLMNNGSYADSTSPGLGRLRWDVDPFGLNTYLKIEARTLPENDNNLLVGGWQKMLALQPVGGALWHTGMAVGTLDPKSGLEHFPRNGGWNDQTGSPNSTRTSYRTVKLPYGASKAKQYTVDSSAATPGVVEVHKFWCCDPQGGWVEYSGRAAMDWNDQKSLWTSTTGAFSSSSFRSQPGQVLSQQRCGWTRSRSRS